MIVCTLFLVPAGLRAQEFRATISGTVTDTSGAVVPGASIEVKETSTGTISKVTSDAAGQYVAPYLMPGQYTITAKAAGFKVLTRTGITLQAQEHPIVNLSLEVGSATQSVTVTEATPLLDAANASISTVIPTSAVADLPLNGRTPASLAEMSPGVITTAAPEQIHPFDNNAGNSWSIGGTPNQVSEVLLDGSPDETLLGALAFSPSEDSVKEVSVQPFATDASFGHTIGGVINQVTKSGTNQFHGTAYEFGQISGIDANLFYNSKFWNSVNGVPTAKPLPAFHFNQYGATFGGPVWLPKVYNGQNKLFFFFAWEGLKDSTPASTFLTVPTTQSIAGSPGSGGEANGDFYQLLTQGVQLYDPRSSVNNGGKITRTPIANNQLRSVDPNLDAVGLAYMKLFPAPNATGTATGQNNYNSNAPSIDNYDNEFGRLDYNVNANDHVFLDVRHNNRTQIKNNYFDNNTTGTTLTRENLGTTVDNVYTLNPTTFFDTRVNWTLFYETHGTPAQAYNSTDVNIALPGKPTEEELPYINFNANGSCATGSYECLGDTGSALDPGSSYQIFTDMTKLIGRHTLKVGFDGRQYRLSVQNFGDASGSFTFNTSWTNAGSSGVSSGMGYDLAALLLGVPSSGEYDYNARADYHQNYFGIFAQDDWRATDKLTLNLGLRFDTNTGFEERLGRTVNGFNPAATVNYSGTPAWASTTEKNPDGSSYTVANINLNGGLTFPSGNNGAAFTSNSGFLSPRIGFAYGLDNKTVVRGGFGVFVQAETMSNEASTGVTSSNAISNQEGFSASSSFVTSTNGVNVTGTLENPFSQAPVPVGSSQGASTFLGSPSAINFLAPNQHDPYSERWDLDVQRSLSNSLMVEAFYVGNHGVHLPVGAHNINAVEQQYLSTTPYFNWDLNNAYGTKINNPFKGTLGATNTTGLNTSSTESFSNFIVPFPQYGTTAITEQNLTEGQSWFNSGILHVEKRAGHGMTLTANYSFSKMIEADSFRNDQDAFLERRISPFDHTHHFTVGGIYELPFGQGKTFNFGGNRLLDELFGGYVLNGIYQFQTGAPIYFSADIPLAPGITSFRQIKNSPRNTSTALGGTALNTAAFVTTPTPKTCSGTCDGSVNIGGQYVDHYRTLPTTFSWVRQDGYNNLDASILKDFHFTEGKYFQLRFETFNTTNHPIFAAPNVSSPTASTFGAVTSTTSNSLPRQIQIGGRLVF
jgi:Carboxypeptidase regulatory-like domain